MNNSSSRQLGNFSIEFALIAFIFMSIIVFLSHVTVTISTQGKLDRLSYSGVSVLKERNQLYGSEHYQVTNSEARYLETLLKSSMSRIGGGTKATIVIDAIESGNISLDSDGNKVVSSTFSYKNGPLSCSPTPKLTDSLNLVVETSWERFTSLYSVTICVETPNWYGDLVGANFNQVSSTSIMMGR